VNNSPVILSGERIQIPLAQKTLTLLWLDKVVDGAGVAPEFRVEHADRPGILQSAVYGLCFFIPPHFLGHLGRCDG
jgi:hypothetical protein